MRKLRENVELYAIAQVQLSENAKFRESILNLTFFLLQKLHDKIYSFTSTSSSIFTASMF